MKKGIRIFSIALSLLTFSILWGPKAEFGSLEPAKITSFPDIRLDALENYVNSGEDSVYNLKPGNRARIVWADSIPARTRYAVVYLHGFSASEKEGDPIHLDFAERYGFNLYLARIKGHGVADPDAFLHLTPNDMIISAKEAVAVGQLLGEGVILMSCSTGGTLSLYLASENPELIDALIMFSPNIEIANQTTKLLTKPWGQQLGSLIAGDYVDAAEKNEDISKYWTTRYRVEGVIALQSLLDRTMNEEVFSKVTQPYFIGYYYKNETEQDPVISVEAIREFDQMTSTFPENKVMRAFPDAGAHVISSRFKSGDVAGVEQAVFEFAERVLKLKAN